MARKLGARQEGVLRSIKSHGSWSPGCGWHWQSDKITEEVLQSLLKRGLVDRDDDGVYRPIRSEEEVLEERVRRVQFWMSDSPGVIGLVGGVMQKLGVASVRQMAAEHRDEFESVYAAIETMEEEAPEPGMPWPT